jgi:hypothetical protein
MKTPVMRYLLVPMCVLTLLQMGVPLPLNGETVEVHGTIAGKIYEGSSRTALSDVIVNVQSITTNQRFASGPTDARGSYVIPNVPSGIYAFSLSHQGVEYEVTERLDARAGMSFLLESCFQLNPGTKTASVLQECKSDLYSDTQVVSIGPQRYFQTDGPQQDVAEDDWAQGDAAQSLGQGELLVTHTALECFANDQYSLLNATIEPGEIVQSSRVYFRAEQYPDFYYVEMEGTGDAFTAVLPIPSPDTERIVYYIEAVDIDFNSAQTPEADPEVADSDSCERRDPAAAYFTGENPDIVVGAVTAGVPAVPLGFQASGITGFISATGVVTSVGAAAGASAAGAAAAGAAAAGAAGAGSALGTVLIVSGAAAAAGAVAVEATKQDEASSVVNPQR